MKRLLLLLLALILVLSSLGIAEGRSIYVRSGRGGYSPYYSRAYSRGYSRAYYYPYRSHYYPYRRSYYYNYSPYYVSAPLYGGYYDPYVSVVPDGFYFNFIPWGGVSIGIYP